MLLRTLLFSLPSALVAGGAVTAVWERQPVPAVTASAAPERGIPGQLSPYPAKEQFKVALGRDRLVHARAMIDGTPVDFVVDTGATRTVLSGRDARQVFGQAGGQQIGRIQTFKGYQPLYQGQARTVTLGAVQLHDVPIGLVPDSQVSVLGLDWLALVGPVTLVS